VVRQWPKVKGYVAPLARNEDLQDADIDDAQQEGMVAVLRAIPRFDCLCQGGVNRSRLHRFLTVVVRRRFCNFLRTLRGGSRPYTGMAMAAQGADDNRRQPSSTRTSVDTCLDFRERDPAEAAERSEERTR